MYLVPKDVGGYCVEVVARRIGRAALRRVWIVMTTFDRQLLGGPVLFLPGLSMIWTARHYFHDLSYPLPRFFQFATPRSVCSHRRFFVPSYVITLFTHPHFSDFSTATGTYIFHVTRQTDVHTDFFFLSMRATMHHLCKLRMVSST